MRLTSFFTNTFTLEKALRERDAKIALLEARIVPLEQIIAKQSAEIAELKRRLNLNSSNSSKPPSTDGLKKQKTQSQREKSGKPSGGQKGHAGKTLLQVDKPDEVQIHELRECSECQTSLENVAASSIEKRQVFEIPKPKLDCIEHQCGKKICPNCGHLNVAAFPPGVEHPVQYGPRTKGLITYLQHYQMIPYERLAEFFKDIFGTSLSEGTVFNTTELAYKNLASFEAHVVQRLIRSKLLHADETGLRVIKKLHWLHVASNDRLTHYFVHEKRGRIATEAAGILSNFLGTLIHDCWAPYFSYCFAHALCNAHLLRELNGITESTQQAWSSEMRDLLRRSYQATQNCQEGTWLSEQEITEFEKEYHSILLRGCEQTGGLKPAQTTKARNLWKRLLLYQREVLRFMHDSEVPFDNNQAERDVRMMKVKQKISGCFRSKTGAEHFARIRAYISTAKKQDQDILSALQGVFIGRPFMPAT